ARGERDQGGDPAPAMTLLPVQPAWRLADCPEQQRWLVDGLWSEEAGGIIGGEPKCCKSFLALDLAVAVAAGIPCPAPLRGCTPGSRPALSRRRRTPCRPPPERSQLRSQPHQPRPTRRPGDHRAQPAP